MEDTLPVNDDLHFADNYRDLCRQGGTGSGFQFEFYCECCNDTWRSPFDPYRSGQASGWMQQASSLLGGLLGGAGSSLDEAAEGFAQAGWGPARDTAFRQAIEAAQAHFHRCARCHNYACDSCWDADRGLCRDCAPDLATEIQAARHGGTLEAATERARAQGSAQGERLDVASARQLVCPACHAEARGGKFCPQCGHSLDAPATCAGCHAALPAGSRFCPECGHAASA
ncbi:MAG: zinc ribbon domain-containing protein [Rhodanobacter sp.]